MNIIPTRRPQEQRIKIKFDKPVKTTIGTKSVLRCGQQTKLNRNGHFVPVFGTDKISISTVLAKMKSVNYGCTDSIWSTVNFPRWQYYNGKKYFLV